MIVRPEGSLYVSVLSVLLLCTALQDVFAGPYLDDPEEREKFGLAYRAMTDAFLAPPICLPGTNVWKGRQGRFFIIKVGVCFTEVWKGAWGARG